MTNLQDIRSRIRSGEYQGNTSGMAPGNVQANLVIIEKDFADEFAEFCKLNSKPCPLIGVSQPGDVTLPGLCDALDIRQDLPEYHIFKNGDFFEATPDISSYWHEGMVAMAFGCSFSFEEALTQAGFAIRNVEMDVNVSMFETDLATKPTEHFGGNVVVTMRPFKKSQIIDVVSITEQFSRAHGAPLHIGDPEKIGIYDLSKPDFGDPVTLEDDDIPVFWGCGVTTQLAVRSAKLPLVITHAPGKMLITDRQYSQLPQL